MPSSAARSTCGVHPGNRILEGFHGTVFAVKRLSGPSVGRKRKEPSDQDEFGVFFLVRRLKKRGRLSGAWVSDHDQGGVVEELRQRLSARQLPQGGVDTRELTRNDRHLDLDALQARSLSHTVHAQEAKGPLDRWSATGGPWLHHGTTGHR